MQFSAGLNLILYIIVIIACTSTATLYMSRAITREGDIYKVVSSFMIGSLFYTIFEMYLTLMATQDYNLELYFIVVVLSDCSYFVIVASWVLLIIIMTGNPYIVNSKKFVIFTVGYGLLVETVAIIYRHVPEDGIIQASVLSKVVLAIDLIFDVTVFIIGIIMLVYAIGKMKEEKQRKWTALLSVMLSLYMLYIIWWDVCSCLDVRYDVTMFLNFDPVHFFYLVICAIVLYLIIKKDEIRLGYYIANIIGLNKEEVSSIEDAARKYTLTMREIEVVQLVYDGWSNPDIAEKLVISENTVKHHLNSIYKKTHTKSRFQLIHIINEKTKL